MRNTAKTVCLACFVTTILVAFSQTASATNITSITKDAFGLTTVKEGFEKPLSGPNVAEDTNDEAYSQGMMAPNQNQPYTWDTGLILKEPCPNPIGDLQANVMVFKPEEGFGFGDNGNLSSSNQLPDGDHMLIYCGSTGKPATLRFAFTQPVSKFGGYFTEAALNGLATNYMEADFYATDGHKIGSTLIPVAKVSALKTSFQGFMPANGESFQEVALTPWNNNGTIANVGYPAVDSLWFEPAAVAVPEPGTLPLLAASVLTALFIPRRFRRKMFAGF